MCGFGMVSRKSGKRSCTVVETETAGPTENGTAGPTESGTAGSTAGGAAESTENGTAGGIEMNVGWKSGGLGGMGIGR